MRDFPKRFLILSLLMLLALSNAGRFSSSTLTSARVTQDSSPREPLGVFAKVNIETLKKQAAFKDCARSPGCDIHLKFRELYARLLANPAISGLTIGAHWDSIQFADDAYPEDAYPDGYDFSFLDDAFEVANRPSVNKSVKLIITPGVVSPPWLMDKIPDCTNKEGVFLGDGVDSQCGKQAFEGFPEEQRDDGNNKIPLPWNDIYQTAWKVFLGHLNDKYGSNPAFVAIAVAGPIAASDEMILPTSENDKVSQPSLLPVDETWRRLIKHSFGDRYDANPDEAFVDAWKTTIINYEKIFSGVTLILSPDGGKDLPEFHVQNVTPPDDFPPHLFTDECSRTPTPLSCEAKTEVIWDFMNATCLTSPYCVNVKATQIGGLRASNDDGLGNIGIYGVKLLTSWPPPPSPPLLGGAAFNHAVSGKFKQEVGCPDFFKDPNNPNNKIICPGLSVEEAAYNAMAVFFNNTPAAAYFKGTLKDFQKGNVGSSPMHYLEVPVADVEYANKNQCISQESPTLGYMTLQQLLEDASRDLFGIANGTLPTVDTTPPVTTPILAPPTGLNGWYLGPTVLNFKALDDLSGVIRTEVSRDNLTTWEPLACDGIALNDDGAYTVFFRSKDLAGNRETRKSITVKIDSTAPVTTAQYLVLDRQVSFVAADNLSGVARTEYRLDGSSWIKGTSLVFTSGGLHTILFRSIDVAGNVEKTNSMTLNVKLNAPPIHSQT
jgi:hypothetical protein